MYIRQSKGFKYYHYKIGEKIKANKPYTKTTKISPIGRKYVEVKKKITNTKTRHTIVKKKMAVNHPSDLRIMYVVDGIYIFPTKLKAKEWVKEERRENKK